jgi:dinuclear metal center YbgI/SA1388 family protein
MESLAPQDLAEPWDNVGLQVGSRYWPVNTVWVALDPAPDVVSAACVQKADLLITHHPLIFKAVKSLDLATPIGSIIQSAIRHRLAIFAAHTNFDAAPKGLNDILAKKIGLVSDRALIASETNPAQGIGRVGSLDRPTTLAEYAVELRQTLGVPSLRYVGRPSRIVRKVAICTGSGGSLMDAVFSCDADVFVTGDLKYHDARAAEWADVGLVDIGHFASEQLMVGALGRRLDGIFKGRGAKIAVYVCDLEKDPFHVVPS